MRRASRLRSGELWFNLVIADSQYRSTPVTTSTGRIEARSFGLAVVLGGRGCGFECERYGHQE